MKSPFRTLTSRITWVTILLGSVPSMYVVRIARNRAKIRIVDWEVVDVL